MGRYFVLIEAKLRHPVVFRTQIVAENYLGCMTGVAPSRSALRAQPDFAF